MGTERMPPTSVTAGVPSVHGGSPREDAAARALRAQLLATEHWSLLATRSLSWNESFSRAGMFLSLLSGAVVALALVAQATSFGEGFFLFGLLLLPVVLFVGIATYVRLVEINNEDVVWVLGMNRLRRAYLDLDPELEPHFITGVSEDPGGVMRTYGTHLTDSGGLLHGLVTTPTTIGFVDATLAGVLAAILLVQLRMQMAPVAAVGVAVFLATVVVLGVYGYRSAVMAGVTVADRAESALPARTASSDER
jgi:hypothetical protein